ncbi:MAG: type II secretion system protein [bacterium]
MNTKSLGGFTLVEMLIVLAIIGVLASIVVVAVGGLPKKARDTKRLTAIRSLSRVLDMGCYLPQAGAGDYDLAQIFSEWKGQNPDYAKYIIQLPQDPKTGNPAQTNYRYTVTADKHCVLYANLENDQAVVDLPQLTEPTPASGVGILQAGSEGWNGSNKYYQYSR